MKIIKKFSAWFTKQKIVGKVVVVVVILTVACCFISVPIALLTPSTPTIEIAATDIPTEIPTNIPQPTATEAIMSRCVVATDAQMDAIRAGMDTIYPLNTVKSGWAVKSNDYENVWFVAAKIYGDGMEDGAGPGLWAMGGTPSEPNGIFSVDGFALEFSTWADGPKSAFALSTFDDGAQEALACARNE